MKLLKLLTAGAVGLGLLLLTNEANKEEKERIAEDNRRKNTPCNFDGAITESEFQTIVRSAAKPIRRLKIVEIDGPIVHCSVRSSSGITIWRFTLDFNDYGEITGKCWSTTENKESTIPDVLIERIQDGINTFADVE